MKFLFYADKTDLSGKILYHHSVSMIFFQFTFLVEYLEIGCYQITELFCLRYCFVGASSARRLRNLGSQAYSLISVLWEVSEDAVLT